MLLNIEYIKVNNFIEKMITLKSYKKVKGKNYLIKLTITKL